MFMRCSDGSRRRLFSDDYHLETGGGRRRYLISVQRCAITSRAALALILTPPSPHTDTVHAPKPLHPHCVGCCGSQCAHESAYSSSDRPHAYTRAQDTQPSHPARRAATARSRHTSHRERGVCTGERTFRGAIWARDHASPSNLAPRLSPAQRASTRVVRALSRRGRDERASFRVVSTRRPGTLSSAL
jgi:hypothetical protein